MGVLSKNLPSPLTAVERAEFAKLEETVTVGIRSFVEAGKVLARIRDGQLFRESHDDFEAYVAEKWKMSCKRAIRLIEAAEVVRILAPTGTEPAPATERQARPLTKLSPASQRDAWAEAIENAPRDAAGKPVVTPEAIEAAVAKRNPKGK